MVSRSEDTILMKNIKIIGDILYIFLSQISNIPSIDIDLPQTGHCRAFYYLMYTGDHFSASY